MTGKTHMAISTAAVAVALSASGARSSGGQSRFLFPPCLLSTDLGAPTSGPSGAYAIAGLLVLGMVAGLFPDLDAPDTELQHLPGRAARQLGRYITAGLPGLRSRSALARLLAGVIQLLVLPLTLPVEAIGVALRATTSHRGFTHTLVGALVFTCSAAGAALLITGSILWSLAVGFVWLLGYASHLAADACTPSGIPLLMLLRRPARMDWAPAQDAATRRRGAPTRPARRPGWVGWSNSFDAPNARLARYPGHSGHPDPSMQRGQPSLLGHEGAPMFHLLPQRMRVRTGTLTDTLLVRWVAWTICALAVIRIFAA